MRKYFKRRRVLDNRIELQNALDFVRKGYTLLVTRHNRAFRSNLDFYKSLEILKNKKVEFQATSQEFDSTTSYGRMMRGMPSVMSEFENDIRDERQLDVMKSAKERGVKFGAKRKMRDEQVIKAMELQKTGELINQEIADKFGVGRSTFLRYVAEWKKKGKDERY